MAQACDVRAMAADKGGVELLLQLSKALPYLIGTVFCGNCRYVAVAFAHHNISDWNTKAFPAGGNEQGFFSFIQAFLCFIQYGPEFSG